jgi:Raf kinase inhibitor-like YbhB/YbcL family protein
MLIHLSSVFSDGALIPRRHTADGMNISPALKWRGIPEATRSFALIVDDPDAHLTRWTHWVLYNIPARCRELPEHIPSYEQLSDGTRQGLNYLGRTGYSGPHPATGTHRYRFRLFALDSLLTLRAGIREDDLLAAMEGHILATGELTGRYRRQS